jgi:hypothetical protein
LLGLLSAVVKVAGATRSVLGVVASGNRGILRFPTLATSTRVHLVEGLVVALMTKDEGARQARVAIATKSA